MSNTRVPPSAAEKARTAANRKAKSGKKKKKKKKNKEKELTKEELEKVIKECEEDEEKQWDEEKEECIDRVVPEQENGFTPEQLAAISSTASRQEREQPEEEEKIIDIVGGLEETVDTSVATNTQNFAGRGGSGGVAASDTSNGMTSLTFEERGGGVGVSETIGSVGTAGVGTTSLTFEERGDIGVPIEFNGNLTYNATVIAPEPEPGFNTAKIIVVTDCGVSNEKEYTYLDVCVPTPPPESNEDINIEGDVVDAYDDCLTNINDLFCKPTIDFGNDYGFLDVRAIYAEIVAVNGKLATGTLVLPKYILQGTGTYQFYIFAENDLGQTIELYDSGYQSVKLAEGESLEVYPERSIIVEQSHKSIMIIMNVFDTMDLATDQKAKGYEVLQTPVIDNQPQEVRRLAADNDLSDSNKEIYISLPSSVEDLEKTTDNLNDVGLVTADPYRDFVKSFWILNRERTKFIFNSPQADFPISITRGEPIGSGMQKYYSEVIAYKEQVSFSAESVKEVVYDYQKPYTQKEYDKAENPVSTKIIDIRPEYNFYFKEYEEVQQDFAGNRENLLPNMYYLLLKDQVLKTGRTEKREQQIVVDPDIDNLIALVPNEIEISAGARAAERELSSNARVGVAGRGASSLVGTTRGTLEPSTRRNAGLSLQQTVTEVPKIDDDYYDYFIDKYKDTKIDRDFSLIERSKNVVVPYSFLPKIEEFSKKNQGFPMFADVRFNTDDNGEVSRKLEQSGLGEWLFLNCINKFIDNENVQNMTFLKQQQDGEGKYFEQTNRYIDITDIEQQPREPEDKFVFLGDYKEYQKLSTTGTNLELQKAQFKQDISSLIKTRGRKYAEILAGKKCYREQVFYRIAKFGADKTNPIQNIWIPNDPSKDYLRYVDTQLVYEKRYTYRIYSYDFVIANEYDINTDSVASQPTGPGPSGDRPELNSDKVGNAFERETGHSEDSSSQQDRELDFDARGGLPDFSAPEQGRELDFTARGGLPGYAVNQFNTSKVTEDVKSILNEEQVVILDDPAYEEFTTNLDTSVLSEQTLNTPQLRSTAASSLVNIKNNIKVYLIENVYDELETEIRDRPPIFPNVMLNTYLGIDNKLLILLNKSSSTSKQKEVIIKPEDKERFEEVKRSQGLETEDELIEFSGDDEIKKYQIFRTTTPPRSYEDFSDALMIEEQTEMSNAASYEDSIRPNTKYYYTFRCVDVHDQISNPTEVYEVEIINESGTIYPLIKPYSFPEKEPGQETKDVKRFLMIKPNALQSYMEVDTDEVGDYKELERGKVSIGVKERSALDKTYKMRLISKNSNKVYDIKFSFGKTVKIIE